MNGARIEVIGHGGAGDFFPGNSRASIQKAIDLKVDRIEVDVLATADDDLVLVHDEKLADGAGKKQWIRKLPTEYVRSKVDQMLTLDQFFEMIGPSMPVLLDLKRPGYESAIAAAVKQRNPPDVWISTTHASTIFKLRRELPNATFGLSSGHIATGFPKSPLAPMIVRAARVLMPIPLLLAAKICGARMIMVNHRACSRWLVRAAQARQLGVAVWTVNRPSDIRRVVEMGVDAIISNRPDLVREIVED